ncbi:TetR/AcrR family transcriptional regulator [Williamsia sp. SKLECPSW1]
MDLERGKTRRRGAELEEALLEAAWDELAAVGYAAMTFEGVAGRAGTSRPVVYRRWPTKADLVRAAIHHFYENNPVDLPDTGTLRGDLVALLEAFGRQRKDVIAIMTVRLSAYFEETGTQLVDLRNAIIRGAPPFTATLLERAADRGEIPTAAVSPRILSLPLDLLRNEMVFVAPVDRETIEDIVDEVFLPLVGHHREHR